MNKTGPENAPNLASYTATFKPNSASLLAFTDELLWREVQTEGSKEGIESVNRRILARKKDPIYAESRELVLSLWRQCDDIGTFREAYNAAVDAMPLEYPSSDGLKNPPSL